MRLPDRPVSPVRGLAVALLAAGAAGCGDDLAAGADAAACVDTIAAFPEGPLDAPDELPLDCLAGGLAERDLGGRWIIEGEGAFDVELPFVRDSCDGGFAIERQSFGDDVVHRDDDQIMVRTALVAADFELVSALRACVDAATGELAVVRGTCFDGECELGFATMRRFARPAGEEEASGLELVSEWRGGDAGWAPGASFNVQVEGELAFVARSGELRVVDVSDPAAPADLGSYRSELEGAYEDFNDLKVLPTDGGLFVILAGATSPVVDVSDPAAPVAVATLDAYAHSVFVRVEDGRALAYLANYGNTVPIYDVTDPAAPALVEVVTLAADVEVHDLYAERDRLLVNGTTAGFQVVEKIDGAWVVAGTMPASYSHASWAGELGGRPVAIHGDEGRGAMLQTVDLDPTSPGFLTPLGSYQTRPEVSVHNMMLVGERAYLTYYQDGVRVLDVSDPVAPRLVAYHHTWDLETGASGSFEGAIGLDVDAEAGLIYVADTRRGLLIFRETDAAE